MTPECVDIAELVSLIWSTTLDLSVEPLAEGVTRGWPSPAVEAQVQVTGDWRGALVLHASPVLVGRITQRMFALGDEPPSINDMQDALGEIANMLGGNVKGMLSNGHACLSLPAVVHGADYTVRVPGSRQVSRQAFVCEGQPFVVTLLEADLP